MITVYTVTYNEELLIQFMIDHYRVRFPNCRIVVNHNKLSTDNTLKIALSNDCEIRYDNNNKLRDEPLTMIKNNCWKDAKTDWVLVCDLDELLDINEAELKQEERSGTTIIRSEAYDMIDMEDKLDIAGMKYGARAEAGDKAYLFNKKYISEINYSPGAHKCNPKGSIKYSNKAYKLYHYCYINYDVTVEKYRVCRARLSPEDIKNGYSFYEETPEEIRDLYTEARSKVVKVR